MIKRMIWVSLLVLATVAVTARASSDGPKLVPVPSTEGQKALIKEGVALHDKGEYDAAIKKYEEVLTENPSNVEAMYELSYTFEAKKDYQKSLDTARKGTQYKSDLLGQFYVVIGNDLDDMGQHEKAISTYREGIAVSPGDFLLYYNLALAYDRQQKWDEARKALKTSAMLNPRHASSQLLLAVEFSRSKFRVPSLLAAARFLVLEPTSSRADKALEIIQQAMSAGVSAGDQPGHVNIIVDPNPRKEEGDFSSVELFLQLSHAAGPLDENGKKSNKSESETMVHQWKVFLDVLGETLDKKKHPEFVFNYYVPYFLEMNKRGLVEPFVYYIHQKTDTAGVSEWLAANQPKVNEFLTWSKQYGWPKQ
jgi:tetratricopeptide (TPR) repeat protein